MAELAAYKNESDDNITLKGPPVAISPALSITMGLAFHELATNAVKHGGLRDPSGRLEVTWAVPDRPTGKQVSLRWEEHGGPPVHPPQRRGFGTTVLEQTLGRMHGTLVRLEYLRQGLRCSIEFPATERGPDLVNVSPDPVL